MYVTLGTLEKIISYHTELCVHTRSPRELDDTDYAYKTHSCDALRHIEETRRIITNSRGLRGKKLQWLPLSHWTNSTSTNTVPVPTQYQYDTNTVPISTQYQYNTNTAPVPTQYQCQYNTSTIPTRHSEAVFTEGYNIWLGLVVYSDC